MVQIMVQLAMYYGSHYGSMLYGALGVELRSDGTRGRSRLARAKGMHYRRVESLLLIK